ncbi:MAG: response regulator [Planctomyces sp.]|nr:response regulator [Planctomyces sp.]
MVIVERTCEPRADVAAAAFVDRVARWIMEGLDGRRPSLLVVDDEIDTCRNLADILEEFDYHVDVAESGEAALDLVRRTAYDIALLDLKMPGMDGMTLCREIRKLQSSTVALIVTAYATPRTQSEVLAAGALEVLPKPVDLGRLLPLLQNVVSQPLVLIVDDDDALRQSLWDLLRHQQYRVGLAESWEDANRHLGSQNYEVVLVDLRLPDGSGRDVLESIRREHPDARTVLITGHRDEMTAGGEEIPADAVCYKPFDMPQLLETIDRLTHAVR